MWNLRLGCGWWWSMKLYVTIQSPNLCFFPSINIPAQMWSLGTLMLCMQPSVSEWRDRWIRELDLKQKHTITYRKQPVRVQEEQWLCYYALPYFQRTCFFSYLFSLVLRYQSYFIQIIAHSELVFTFHSLTH